MSMSRKHFKEFAQMVRELQENLVIENRQVYERIAARVGIVCAGFNGNFDWNRWRSATKWQEA